MLLKSPNMIYKQFTIVVGICLVLLSNVECYRLNVPRVLLPIFDDISSNFTLEGTEGCYEWKSTAADKIKLTPLDIDPLLGCSTKVLISTISKEKSRDLVVVLAEDITTKQTLRCDVILDEISYLEIITTTKELFMGETPEVFEVRAYDEQGNEFSTLEGIEFTWNIYCTGPKKDYVVLRFITFEESPYETPEFVEELEKVGKQGHMVLLETYRTGAAKVTVGLPYKEYKNIRPCEVSLSVVANIIISPTEAYVMVGDKITFKVTQLNDGNIDEIHFPNSQYYFEIVDKNVANLEESGQIEGLVVGKTKIFLHDRNVNEQDLEVKLPSAILNIVQPAYMTLSILPHKNWAILVSDYCKIIAEVYSEKDNRIHLGENSKVQIQVDKIFNVQNQSLNGSWISGYAQEVGASDVNAILYTHNGLDVRAREELEVFPLFFVVPSEVFLPWDPIVKPRHTVQLEVVDSVQSYTWVSGNQSIGLVSPNGRVTTVWHGHFNVYAEMSVNHFNRRSSSFHILPPTRLEILQHYTEGEVGSTIFIYLTLYTNDSHGNEVPFSKCQELPYEIKFSNSNLMFNKSTVIAPVGSACATIGIEALAEGSCSVSVAYRVNSLTLEDTAIINAFNPLKLIYPETNEIALAVGTSFNVLFTGGPKATFDRHTAYKRSVSVENTVYATVDDVTNHYKAIESEEIVLNVVCRKLGQTHVNLTIANDIVVANCTKDASSVAILVVCAKPRSVHLQPNWKVSAAHGCPLDVSVERVLVHSFKNTDLSVSVTDETGRKLLNITSLKFDWSVTPENLAEIVSKSGVMVRNTTINGFLYSNGSYQIVKVKNANRTMEILCKVIGYHKHILKQMKVTAEWPEFMSEGDKGKTPPTIQTKIKLYVVENTIVTPNSTTLYNHPRNKDTLAVSQGSGYYQLELSASDVATVEYLPSKHQLHVVPLRNGELYVKLIDLCLIAPPTLVAINVVSITRIKVVVTDQIEIGRSVACVLKMYDETNKLLTLQSYDLLDVNVDIESDIIAVERMGTESANVYEFHYVVTGRKLGHTKIKFTVDDVSSDTVDVQVFSPLKLLPKNTTMLVGGLLQVSTKGGPQPSSSVEYTAENDIVDIDPSGLIHAKALGSTKIYAVSVGSHPVSGTKVIFSEDFIEVHVKSVSDIKIYTPVPRFAIGTTVPIWVVGIPEDLNLLVIGSVEPPLKFEWNVENSDVIKIQPTVNLPGIRQDIENLISMKVTGLSTGKSTIYLKVTVPENSSNFPFLRETSIFKQEVEIFEHFQLISPKSASTNTVLISPYSSVPLITNMDRLGGLRYGLLNRDSWDNKREVSNSFVKISRDGIVTSLGKTGQSLVFVSFNNEYGTSQSIYVIIEVRHLHYMLLTAQTPWIARHPTNTIPVGAEFALHVSYHDETGATFSGINFPLKFYSTRSDLVEMRAADESSLIVQAKKAGSAVLKVWSGEASNCLSYLRLTIGAQFSPHLNSLTMGDIVCFSSGLKGVDLDSVWNSSDSSVLNVHSTTGIAQVVGDMTAQVSLSHSLHPAVSLQINVEPATAITIMPNRNKPLSNAAGLLPYRIPVVIGSDAFPHKNNNLLRGYSCDQELDVFDIQYPFKCYMQFSNDTVNAFSILHIQPGFDVVKGYYTCEIIATNIIDERSSTLLTDVIVWAEIEDSELITDQLTIQFLPGVFVTDELDIDASFNAHLTIDGIAHVLDNVEVQAVDPTLLRVKKGARVSEFKHVYEIRVLDYHWKLNEVEDALSVLVHSKLTEQTIKVRLKVKENYKSQNMQCAGLPSQSPLLSFFQNNYQTILIVISTAVALFAGLLAYSHFSQPIINVNLSPSRNLFNGNVSARGPRSPPLPGSPFLNQNYSISNASISPLQRTQTMGSSSPLNREPVYGDDSSHFYGSPDVRRNRTFL